MNKSLNKYVGKKFNKLKVISLKRTDKKDCYRGYFVCVCDCGNKKTILARSILIGSTKSCGCLWRSKGGNSRRPLSKTEFSYASFDDNEFFSKVQSNKIMFQKLAKRFNASLLLQESGCIVFTKGRNKNGYGRILVTSNGNGRAYFAHRLAWLFYHGSIQPRMIVMHSCDNPSCCRIDHLSIATQKDNVLDMIKKGRRKVNWGEKNGNSKLSLENVKEIRILKEAGARIELLSKRFHVSVSTIRRIINGNSWGNGTIV